MISQTYCDIPKIDWKTQTNKFILPHSNGFSPSLSEHWTIVFIQLSVFTQTGRKIIGMWSFVKLQQVDVFKTMLIQKKQCSAQLSQAQPIELEFLKKLTN